MRKVFASLFVIVAVLPIVACAYANPGSPAGFVNDFAGLLQESERATLEQKLSSFEKETSNEISVVTVPNLGGDSIENFAVKLFEEWKIGKTKKDNGVLLLIARDERKIRIEVGYGLEGALTDAQSYWIISDVISRNFKAENYYAGIDGGVSEIMKATQGEYVPSSSPIKEKAAAALFEYWYLIPVAIVWLASILGRSKSWWLGGVLGGASGVVIGIISGFLYAGVVALGVLIPLGLIFDYFVSRSYDKFKSGGGVPPWWLGGGGFGGGHSSGFGDFGGFGGGRSGGGGSSGDW